MSSAVCWKWIFSVERKRTGSVRARGSAQGDDPRSPQGQALTIRGCVDDQELLPFQCGHPVCHLGHLQAGRGVSMRPGRAVQWALSPCPGGLARSRRGRGRR